MNTLRIADMIRGLAADDRIPSLRIYSSLPIGMKQDHLAKGCTFAASLMTEIDKFEASQHQIGRCMIVIQGNFRFLVSLAGQLYPKQKDAIQQC